MEGYSKDYERVHSGAVFASSTWVSESVFNDWLNVIDQLGAGVLRHVRMLINHLRTLSVGAFSVRNQVQMKCDEFFDILLNRIKPVVEYYNLHIDQTITLIDAIDDVYINIFQAYNILNCDEKYKELINTLRIHTPDITGARAYISLYDDDMVVPATPPADMVIPATPPPGNMVIPESPPLMPVPAPGFIPATPPRAGIDFIPETPPPAPAPVRQDTPRPLVRQGPAVVAGRTTAEQALINRMLANRDQVDVEAELAGLRNVLNNINRRRRDSSDEEESEFGRRRRRKKKRSRRKRKRRSRVK